MHLSDGRRLNTAPMENSGQMTIEKTHSTLYSINIFEHIFLARDISESNDSNQLLNLTDCLLNFEYNGPALTASQF